jgi:hypothetical protein
VAEKIRLVLDIGMRHHLIQYQNIRSRGMFKRKVSNGADDFLLQRYKIEVLLRELSARQTGTEPAKPANELDDGGRTGWSPRPCPLR